MINDIYKRTKLGNCQVILQQMVEEGRAEAEKVFEEMLAEGREEGERQYQVN